MFVLVTVVWGYGFEVKAEKCFFSVDFVFPAASGQQRATGDVFLNYFSPHPSAHFHSSRISSSMQSHAYTQA